MTEQEAVVLCGAKASDCSCTEPPGHEPPHRCSLPPECGGEWTGSYDSDDFQVVRLPAEGEYPAGSLLGMISYGWPW